jgi:hypothetical protein
MKKFLLAILLFVVYSPTNGQQSPEELVTRFFNTFETQGSSKALDELYANNIWINKSSDAITQLKSQVNELNEDFVGKYNGYEKLLEKRLSSCYLIVSYMVKYERQPIRFTFEFYKPKDKWVTHSFSFDGNIGEEMAETMKLQLMDFE